jgi:hypothetical protein
VASFERRHTPHTRDQFAVIIGAALELLHFARERLR